MIKHFIIIKSKIFHFQVSENFFRSRNFYLGVGEFFELGCFHHRETRFLKISGALSPIFFDRTFRRASWRKAHTDLDCHLDLNLCTKIFLSRFTQTDIFYEPWKFQLKLRFTTGYTIMVEKFWNHLIFDLRIRKTFT